MKRLNKKGFTIAELLIVVAIIAVLVAIAIPVFNAQLEKSRKATDLANIRSSFAEATADALTNNDTGNGGEYVAKNGDLDDDDLTELTGKLADAKTMIEAIEKGNTIKVVVDKDGNVTSVVKE